MFLKLHHGISLFSHHPPLLPKKKCVFLFNSLGVLKESSINTCVSNLLLIALNLQVRQGRL